MTAAVLDTEIDELLKVINDKGKLKVEQAAKIMGVDKKIMQSWVDFLVEEHVLMLDYDFMTPIVRLTPKKKEELKEKKDLDSVVQKEESEKEESEGQPTTDYNEFHKKAKERGFEEQKIKVLWNQFVDINRSLLRDEFIQKAEKRGLSNIEDYWQKYYAHLKNKVEL